MDARPTHARPDADGMPSTQPPGRFARLLESWFGRTTDAVPAGEPFRDSDFEQDSGFFGRPLGEH